MLPNRLLLRLFFVTFGSALFLLSANLLQARQGDVSSGWIVFVGYRNGQSDLYRILPDGRGLRPLTQTPQNEDGVAVSPDGRWLVFRRERAVGDGDLYRM